MFHFNRHVNMAAITPIESDIRIQLQLKWNCSLSGDGGGGANSIGIPAMAAIAAIAANAISLAGNFIQFGFEMVKLTPE